MAKMKLNLDALSVETFEMDEGAAARGTIRGHDSDEVAIIPTTDWKTCRTCPICTQQPDTCNDLCSSPCVVNYTDQPVVA